MENGSSARPHPDMDSLAPARSALRAFGFAEFPSRLRMPLKSPPGEGESLAGFLKFRAAELVAGASNARETGNGKSSPWGEDTGEGGRHTNLPERDCVRRISRSAWWGEASDEPAREDAHLTEISVCFWPCASTCGWSATQPRSGESGGEHADMSRRSLTKVEIQTLREVRGRRASASAFGVRWL